MPAFDRTVFFDHNDIIWAGVYLATAVCLPFLAPPGTDEPAYALVFLCCFLSLFHFLFKSDMRALTNVTFLCSIIFFTGLSLRLLFVFYYPPGENIEHALWYGLLQLHGQDPSVFMPGVSDLARLSSGPLADVLARIPYPEAPANAGHLTLLLWQGTAWLSPTPVCFRLVSVIIDCLVFALLAQILLKQHLPVIWSVLYWLNPLVLTAVAGEGCVSSPALLFLCMGCVAFLSQRNPAGFLCFGLAGASQALLLPLGLLFLSKKNVAWSPLLLLPIALGAAFFGVTAISNNITMFLHCAEQTLFSFSSVLALTNSGYTVAIVAILYCTCIGICYVFCPNRMHSLFAAAACLTFLAPGPLLCALSFLAIFMTVYPSRAWLFLMATLPVSLPLSKQLYVVGLEHGSLWTAWLPYAPFCILLAWGLWRGRDRLAHMIGYAPVKSLCVLIPTQNDAVHLVQCVESVRRVAAYNEMDVDILLADAGSTDGTVEQAKELGVRLQPAAPGRSNQIRQALPAITADAVLVLPVDSMLENDSLPRVLAALSSNRHALGGALGMRFAFSDPFLRAVTLCAGLRTRLFGLSCANQGQFFRRRVLSTVGGYPRQEAMDDLELSIRIQAYAPPLKLGGGVRASRRQWSRTSYTALSRRKLQRFVGYLLDKKWHPVRLRAETVSVRNKPL